MYEDNDLYRAMATPPFSPCYSHTPGGERSLDHEEHPEETVVTFPYAVGQPGAVMVEPPHAPPTRVAVLRTHRTHVTTHAAVLLVAMVIRAGAV